jgi:hypothetical protein
MSTLLASASTRLPTRVQVGLHQVRPCPGAVAFQALGGVSTAATFHHPQFAAGGDRTRARRSVALVLAEAPQQQQADAAHLHLLETIAPLLAIGPAGLPLAAELIRQTEVQDGHQVLLWTDGSLARLLFQGNHRIIYVHEGRASLIQPSVPQGVGHCELTLAHGDNLVLVAHSTHAQLPLGTVAMMAQQEPTPQALCERATTQAAASDPLSHHAALAVGISASEDGE